MRRLQVCALNMAIWNGVREGGRVMRTHLRHSLEPRSYLDQCGLAERSAKEAHAQRSAEHHACGHLNNRISGSCSEAGRAKDEVIAVDKIRGPRRIISRRDHCI